MNVLVLGSGGREHSLCYNLIKSKKISNLWCMPGNAGTNRIAKFSNLNTDDNHSILDFCIKKKINLVIPGSEEFLAKGVGDYLRLNGIKVFGPSKKSALLESSKIFTKQICKLGNINTAKWEVFENSKIALKKIRKLKFPIVIKLDKLAAGKGVLVAKDLEDAKRFLKKVEQGKIGDSNSKIIIEKKLTGKEASFFYVVDGNSSKFIGSAQDYKRVGENNTGLNTGGMGCISPSPYENEKNIDMCSNPYGKKLLGKYAFPKKTDTIINIIGRKPTLLKYKEKAPHIRAKQTKDMIRINIVIKLKNKFSNGITEYPMIIDIIKK